MKISSSTNDVLCNANGPVFIDQLPAWPRKFAIAAGTCSVTVQAYPKTCMPRRCANVQHYSTLVRPPLLVGTWVIDRRRSSRVHERSCYLNGNR